MRLSLTTRIMLAVAVAAAVPIMIAYLVLAGRPAQLTSQIVQAQLTGAADHAAQQIQLQRLQLQQRLTAASTDSRLQAAVLQADARAIEAQLQVTSVSFAAHPQPQPIEASATFIQGARQIQLTVARPLSSELLTQLLGPHAQPAALLVDGQVALRSGGFPTSISAHTLQRERIGYVTDLHSHGRSWPAVATPLANAPHDTLIVALTPAQLASASQGQTHDLVLVLLALGGAALALALATALLVNRSMAPLTRMTTAIAGGDYTVRLPAAGRDALAALVHAYNALARRIGMTIGELRTILAELDVGVCVWDNQNVVLYNQAAGRITGVSAAAFTPEHPIYQLLQGCLTPGTAQLTLPRLRDGQPVVVDVVTTQMTDGALLQTIRDVSEAQQLQRTRQEFITTASHQLRTPLTTILGYSDTLLNEAIVLDDEQRRSFIELIHEQSEHMAQLIERMLRVKPQLGESELSLGPVAVGDVIEQALASAGRAAWQHDHIGSDVLALANEQALARVLQALLTNAEQYGAPVFELHVQHVDDALQIRVVDHGPGIEPQHLEQIFEPFYRVDVNMTSSPGGAGLGLFGARLLAAAMGGTITAASDATGTTFTIMLRAAS